MKRAIGSHCKSKSSEQSLELMEVVGTSSEQVEKSDQFMLDVNNLAQSLRAKLEILHPSSKERCIYRIPERMRVLNEDIFTPQLLSIGPFHHGKEKYRAMEEHKRMYRREFLGGSKVSIESFIKVIKESETRLRYCYSETIKFESKDFVEMVLLGASFIIMFLLDPSKTGLSLRVTTKIFVDLLILENQLPFFILEDLFKLSNISNQHDGELSMIKLAYDLLRNVRRSWVPEDILKKFESHQVKHFVDFLRFCLQPSISPPRIKLARPIIPSVTELHQAGVRFKVSSSITLHDIKFNKGILEIPCLTIDGASEMLFRNLLFFEFCHCTDSYVNDYLVMISHLVQGPKDVEILVENRIIENWHANSEAVSTILYNINRETVTILENFYFSGLVKDLNDYCNSPWHKWKATLKQNYFNNPWATISVIAAVFLLILTIIQSVCSIIQVVHPR